MMENHFAIKIKMKFDNEFCGIGNAAECDKTGCIYKTGETAKITVTVELNLHPVLKGFIGEGATVNLNNDIKPIWGENDWDDWNCKIDGDSRDILICEVERTESGSEKITVKPEFPENFVVAGVKETVYGGSRELSDFWFSVEIKKCKGKAVVVEWIDESYFDKKSCYSIESERGLLPDFCCYDIPSIPWCVGEYNYWCLGSKELSTRFGYECVNDAGDHGEVLRDITQWISNNRFHKRDEYSGIEKLCCKKTGTGTQPAEPETTETQTETSDTDKTPTEQKPAKIEIVCGDNKCEGDETCKTCVEDCGECCGDNECNYGETRATCLNDCPPECTVDTCENKIMKKCIDGVLQTSYSVDCCSDSDCTDDKTCEAGGCGSGEKGFIDNVGTVINDFLNLENAFKFNP